MSRWFHRMRVVLRSLVSFRREDDELREEFQHHLDCLIDAGREAGLTPEEARRAAHRAMGPIESSKEACRDVRPTRLVRDLAADLRYAGRAFRRNPGFAALAALVMALGIGANTAVFSVVDAVLLRPLPYDDPDRIVTLDTAFLASGQTQGLVSIANFRDWRDQSSTFEAMATYRGGEFPVTPGEVAEYARVAVVDADFFRVFGVEPVVGRTFTLEETQPGGRAVLVGHDYWQRRLDADPDVLERTVRIGGDPWPIVGVLPPGFSGPRSNAVDVWLPLEHAATASRGTVWRRYGNTFYLTPFVRLAPGATEEAAVAAVTAAVRAARAGSRFSDSVDREATVALGPILRTRGPVTLRRHMRLPLIAGGITFVVLLIAAVNMSNLLMLRVAARRRELAVRYALGLGKWGIGRLLVTESLALAALSSVVALAVAAATGDALRRTLLPSHQWADDPLGATAIGFTATAVLGVGLAAAVAPAVYAVHPCREAVRRTRTCASRGPTACRFAVPM